MRRVILLFISDAKLNLLISIELFGFITSISIAQHTRMSSASCIFFSDSFNILLNRTRARACANPVLIDSCQVFFVYILCDDRPNDRYVTVL